MSNSLNAALAEVASNPDITLSRLKELSAGLIATVETGKIPVFYSGFLPSQATGRSFHTGVLAEALSKSGRFGNLETTEVGRFLTDERVTDRFVSLFPDDEVRKQVTERAFDAPWRDASERYAQGVEGPIISIAPDSTADSVWRTSELPTLIDNQMVTLINGIDRSSLETQLNNGTINLEGIDTTLSNIISWEQVYNQIDSFNFADAANQFSKFAGRIIGPEEIAGAVVALTLAGLVGQEAFDAELEFWQTEIGVGVLFTLGLIATGAIFPSTATTIAAILVPFAVAGLIEIFNRISDLWSQIDLDDSFVALFSFLGNWIDPLTVDLDGDGVNTTSVENSGVTFDLDNNGTEESVGWIEPEDGFIAHDWKGGADGGDDVIQDRSELFATFAELSRHDINGDGVLDASDVAPEADTDLNGDGVIDENDRVQPTVTGDFDGDSTLETINVGWDQLQVWVDADSDGNTDEGELHSLESLGIASIDLNATELDVEDNGNIINSESTATNADGSTSIINGVSFNRNTLNQSYEQQINNLDLTPERLTQRLDVFTMPQMIGSGNVPHLMIAALADDGILGAWRAVSNYDGGDLPEFRNLVDQLLLEWSGGSDFATELRGDATGSVLNAAEAFLGTEYPFDDSTLNSYEQTEAIINAWNGFVNAITLRFYVQVDQFNNNGSIAYDFATNQFNGNWTNLLADLEEQYTDPAVTALEKAALTNLLSAIFSTTSQAGVNIDVGAARTVEEILTEINVVNPAGDFIPNFVVGHPEDGFDSSDFIDLISTSGSAGGFFASEFTPPPGYVLDASRRSSLPGGDGYSSEYANTGNSIQSYNQNGGDAVIFARIGSDVIDVRGAFGWHTLYDDEGEIIRSTEVLVDDQTVSGDGTLFVGNRDNIEFSRDANHLIIKNVETGATVLVKDQFGTSVAGVSYILFDDWSSEELLQLNYLDRPAANQAFLESAWDAALIVENAWYRGTEDSDYIQGTSATGVLGRETYLGGLGDDVLVGRGGQDTYVYNSGDGNDTIVDNGNFGSTDILSLVDITNDQVVLYQRGVDLIVHISTTGQEIRVVDHFSSTLSLGIEEIHFVDGQVWDRDFIANSVVFDGTVGADVIDAPDSSDIIIGGAGDDILDGGQGSDTYRYSEGDGNDVIFDDAINSSSDIDVLLLVNLNVSDIELLRTTDDLIVRVKSTGHEIRVPEHFDLESSFVGLEEIQFADGSTYNRDELRYFAVYPSTEGDDVINGFGRQDESFAGNGGDDILNGDKGSDNYFYSSDDGNDTIVETEALGGSYTDKLVFRDLNSSNVSLTRVGEDLLVEDLTTGQIITVERQFYIRTSWKMGVENIEFADGETWDRAEIDIRINSPRPDAAIGSQTIDEDAEWSFTIPENAFIDPDGQTMTYAVTLANGDPLPDWLDFDGTTLSGTPPANFNGELEFVVIASDGERDASSTFNLVVEAVNDAPIIANALTDQSSPEDEAVSFVLPVNAFSDVDGDTLSVTALLADGSALPAWLTFHETARSFTGTPPADFNGTLSVSITASDGTLSVSDVFDLEITSVNDAPIVENSLSDQSFDEDENVNFVLPENSFTDLDGDALTLSATLTDGSQLPAWLNFDQETRSFNGTPPVNFNGILSIIVSATDGEFSASDTFVLAVASVNDAPVIAIALNDQSSIEDEAVSFVLPEDAFTDVDGYTLNVTALLMDGSALPAWLIFDPETQSFTGIPPLNFNGILPIEVTASDGELSVSDTFVINITAVNDDPVVENSLVDQTSAEDEAISFVLPADAFMDVDGDALTLDATLSDGSILPEWLTFDADVRSFNGIPPSDFNGVLPVTVSASDGDLSASDTFNLAITPVNDGPVANDDTGFEAMAGEALVLDADSVLFNDTDIDGDPLSIISVSETANGTVELGEGGNLLYTAMAGFEGEDSFEYTITDGTSTATANVTVNVESEMVDLYAGWTQGSDGNDRIFGNLFEENQIYGAGGNDRLFGGFGADQIDGGSGNDRITGLFGDDILNGNEGNDRISGGFGNDIISGGEGDDRLRGGLGQDTFIFETGDGRDRIVDFSNGFQGRRFSIAGDEIAINVEGINSFEDLVGTASQEGRNVVFDFGNGDELVLSSTRLAALDKDAFTFF